MARTETSTVVTVILPSILIISNIIDEIVDLIQRIFKPKLSVSECVDVLDPSDELSLLHQPTLTILTSAQGT